MSIYICLCMKVMADKTNKSGWCLSHYSKAWNWFHFFRSHWIPIPMIFPLKLITQVREAFYPHFIPMMFPLRNTKPTNHQLSSVQNPDYSRLSSILGLSLYIMGITFLTNEYHERTVGLEHCSSGVWFSIITGVTYGCINQLHYSTKN